MPGSLVVFSAASCRGGSCVHLAPQQVGITGEAKLPREGWVHRLSLCCPTPRPEFGVLMLTELQHPQFSSAWFPVAAPAVRLMPCGTSHSWFVQKDVPFCLGEEMKRGSEGSKETELN